MLIIQIPFLSVPFNLFYLMEALRSLWTDIEACAHFSSTIFLNTDAYTVTTIAIFLSLITLTGPHRACCQRKCF